MTKLFGSMLIVAMLYYRWKRNLSCWNPLLEKLDFRKKSQPVSFILFPLIVTTLSFLQPNVEKIEFFIEFLSQSSSNLVVFDKISFDHRLVHQCIGKNTHKCFSYWIGCKFIWGSLILSGSLCIMWFISWQCGLYAPLFLQPWLRYALHLYIWNECIFLSSSLLEFRFATSDSVERLTNQTPGFITTLVV